jgi:hypothetical protein
LIGEPEQAYSARDGLDRPRFCVTVPAFPRPQGRRTRRTQEATMAEQSFEQQIISPLVGGRVQWENYTTNRVAAPATIATAGNATYTTANLKAGLILRDCAGAGRTDTTPTAADIVADCALAVGDWLDVVVQNTSDAAETITLAAGVGVTGAASIAQGRSVTLRFRCINATLGSEAVFIEQPATSTAATNLSLSGTLDVAGATTLADTLDVTGVVTTVDDVVVGGGLDVTGNSTLAADTTVDNFTCTGLPKYAPDATPANITTAGDATYSAANLAVGIITRDCNGAGRGDTTDTAANLITGLSLDADYEERQCVIVNTSDDVETITLLGGSGVTIKGAITVEQDTATRIAIMRTGAAAVCVREI